MADSITTRSHRIKVLPTVAFTFTGLPPVARYPKALAKVTNISESCKN